MKSERLYWLDFIKFIACLGVMGSHFLYTFFAGSGYGQIEVSSAVQNVLSVLSVPLNGNFWVFVFCIISGFLLHHKKISNFQELYTSLFSRYVRFVKPFAVTAAVIFLLDVCFGFHTQENAVLLQNQWLKDYYSQELSFYEYISFIFCFDDIVNGPVWMIQALFLGNCLIYFFNYLWNKITSSTNLSNNWYTIVMLFIGILGIYLSFNFDIMAIYVAACIAGAICPLGKRGIFAPAKFSIALMIVWWMLFTYQMNSITEYADPFFIIPQWNFLYALLFVIFINNTLININQKMADLSILLGKISFPVYLFHWPLLCSVGFLIFNFLFSAETISYTICTIVTSLLVTVLTLMISLIYTKYL